MTSLTHNNYFKPCGNGENWSVRLDKCKHKILQDFHNECIVGAQIIAETAKSPITLLYSGGLDGEFMLNVFRTAGIKHKVAIISYGEWNDHDTRYALEYCSTKGITPTIVDIDIRDFIESGKILEVAQQAKCCAYQMPSIMYALTKLDGTLVMANGEPYVKNYNGHWRWQETERVNSYMNWFQQNGIDGTPDFLRYTPEITLSFLKEPVVVDLVNNRKPGKLSTRTSKHAIYSKNYTFTPRPKYTGWEKLEQDTIMSNEIFDGFVDLKKKFNGEFEVDYNILVKALTRV